MAANEMSSEQNKTRIDCRKCIHFKITWERYHPYSCKAFGFKSKNLPSVDVFLSAGQECLKFIPKQKK